MMEMKTEFRSKVLDLGRKGKRLEGQMLKDAGEVVRDRVSNRINRSNISGPEYKHLQDNIIVSSVRTNSFGERFVEVGAAKKLSYKLRFLEFGTSKMSAQAPLSIGADEASDSVRIILTEGMKKVLKL